MEKLTNIPGKNPFKVPENYFEEVNKKILASATGTETKSQKRGLTFRLRPILAVAASVAVLVIASYFAVKIFIPGSGKEDIIPEITLQEFSESYLNDIDIQMLERNSYPLVTSGRVPEISKSELIDYLLLENINEDEIYELL
jgi:hypothetical protein